MPNKYDEVTRTATELLRQAFAELEKHRILPRSRYEPWIHVGRNYEGHLIDSLPAFAAFGAALTRAFPSHFARDSNFQLDFPDLYAFPLIAAAVARSIRSQGDPKLPTEAIVSEAVAHLIAYLRAGREPASVIRLVSDLVAPTSFVMEGLKVVPQTEFRNGSFEAAVEELIPGMGYEIDREDIITAGRTRTFLMISVAPRVTEGDRIHGAFSTAAEKARQRIDQFVSAVRLATGATLRNLIEVEGQTGWFKKYPGDIRRFPYQVFPGVDRDAVVDRKVASKVGRLQSVISKVAIASDDVVPSLALAIGRFDRAFVAAPWTDRLVDLSIALEAAIGEPSERQEITLRLRLRAASLLATTNDPAADIFNDLTTLYKLRSEIVHGSPHRTPRVKKLIESMPATSDASMAGGKVELAIDRLRDLVRRAILARLMLATGSKPTWPLGAESDLDRRLTDDAERRQLRRGWHSALAKMGLKSAGYKAAKADVLG